MDNVKVIIIAIWVLITGAYVRTWNKYYASRKAVGGNTSFNGYLHWLMDNFKNTPKDEYETPNFYEADERTTQEAKRGGAQPGSDAHYEQWKAQQHEKEKQDRG